MFLPQVATGSLISESDTGRAPPNRALGHVAERLALAASPSEI